MVLPHVDTTDPTIQRALTDIQRALMSTNPTGSFADRERTALAVCNEAVRGFVQEVLQGIADELRGPVECNGKQYREHEDASVVYHSLCGPVEVRRPTARLIGVHNGPTIVPLDLAAGLAERTTPALAYALVHGHATEGSREVCERLMVAQRVPPSRATMERVASRLASFAAEHCDPTLDGIRRIERLPEGTTGICVGIDRASTPMREPIPEGETKPKPKRHKPYQRRPPLPYDVVFRMAYVVTVSYVDDNGESLGARRYAAPADDDPRILVGAAMKDVRASMKQAPNLTVGLVQDGAPEMWNLGREGLQTLLDAGVLFSWHEGIDRCHLMGRLGHALEILHREPAERKALLESWSNAFDDKDSTIDDIETWLRSQETKATKSQREMLREHLVYIENNKDRMRYATLRSAGLPVGSGVTESAAKTVINSRTKQSGQRWSTPGLRNVLVLRSLLQSERLPTFWTSLSRRFTANVNCMAAA